MLRKHWAIVLAGGSGTRMQSAIREKFGSARPKQFCTFCGTRSMLQHTLDRTKKLVDPRYILTVTQRRHRVFTAQEQLPGPLFEQPESKDTGVGTFLPLAHVLAKDPDALVQIFPSDHFIYPESAFVEQMKRSRLLAETFSNRVILTAVPADRPETDYGWIEPGERLPAWSWNRHQSAHTVRCFHEKPSAELAREWFAQGHLWNTMILTCRADALWRLATIYAPVLVRSFSPLVEKIRKEQLEPNDAQLQDFIVHLYEDLPTVNLSTELLSYIPEDCLVLPLNGIIWSDWGRTQRIDESLYLLRSDTA